MATGPETADLDGAPKPLRGNNRQEENNSPHTQIGRKGGVSLSDQQHKGTDARATRAGSVSQRLLHDGIPSGIDYFIRRITRNTLFSFQEATVFRKTTRRGGMGGHRSLTPGVDLDILDNSGPNLRLPLSPIRMRRKATDSRNARAHFAATHHQPCDSLPVPNESHQELLLLDVLAGMGSNDCMSRRSDSFHN